jgi:hypothetical protein
MQKLTTRQIIILGIALLAALYGAYDLFVASAEKKVPSTATEGAARNVTALVTDITAALSKDAPKPAEAHTIKRAEAPWARDPFFDRKGLHELTATEKPVPAAAGAAAAPAVKPPFSYTGYVDMGRRKIAIINGNEYAAGDSLDVEGYVLSVIDPNRITVYNKETRRTIEVPLQE